MESIAARALKSSFLSEIIGLKSTQQPSFDDLWCVAGINSSSDEFSIDDLLDLSDKDFNNSVDGDFEESSEEDFASVSSHDNDANSMNSSKFSSSGDVYSLTAGELIVPIVDMESLEWLSNIVNDSVPVLSPASKMNERTVEFSRFEPLVNVNRSFTVLGLPYPVQKKSRTDRSRKAGRLWSTGSGSRSFTESSSSSSSSQLSSITSPVQFFHFENKPAAKKQRKTPVFQTGPGSTESLSQRRCTHCQVQKTPQWRTGPLGPKTLCNACGVRFKSGRLYPEYRPACSPTFSGDVHSNSHRKVLEMRKRKEPEIEPVMKKAVQTGPGLVVEPGSVV